MEKPKETITEEEYRDWLNSRPKESEAERDLRRFELLAIHDEDTFPLVDSLKRYVLGQFDEIEKQKEALRMAREGLLAAASALDSRTPAHKQVMEGLEAIKELGEL